MPYELQPICGRCGKSPEDLEYLDYYKEPDQSRTDYILQEEGTLNPINLHFLCDDCYIAAGQPSSPAGWKCP